MQKTPSCDQILRCNELKANLIYSIDSWIRDVLEAYKARRKELEENTEKSREAQFRTRESKLLVGDTESQKMIEAQLRFDDLYKYDEARIRKEGYMKKSSGGKKDGEEDGFRHAENIMSRW